MKSLKLTLLNGTNTQKAHNSYCGGLCECKSSLMLRTTEYGITDRGRDREERETHRDMKSL